MVKQKNKEEPLIAPLKVNDQKSKPTADQMRIAQILDKKAVDTSIKQKLKQVMDATQRSADEVYVALHDTDFDVNRAVDLLIEGDSLADWRTSEKKKKKLQELKEKKTDDNPVMPDVNEEASKDSRNNSFRGRGDDRRGPGRGRGSRITDRRQRGSNEESSSFRGRGSQGRGRRGQKMTPGGTLVFERSNMGQEQSNPGLQPATTIKNRWERPLIHNAGEDWDTEEFTGSLSHTQIFTSSAKRDLKKVEVVVEEPKTPPNFPGGMTGSPKSLPTPLPQPSSMVQSHSPQTFGPHEMGFGQVNTTFMKREALPQQEVRSPNQDTLSNSPSESHSDYAYHLSNYASKPDLHIPTIEEKKPVPSKIPTSAVEMPPEMKSSLQFLDIQFGAMDIGPSASEVTSSESHSNISSQNASTTNLIPPSSITSSASMTQLIANNSISSSTSSNNLVQTSNISNPTSGNIIGPNSIPSVTGVGHLTPTNNPTGTNVNHLVNSTMPSGGVSHMMGHNNMTGSNHLLGPSGLSSGPPGNQTQGRFMTPGQSYATNLPYSFITTPSGASGHQYESRAHETNTSIPPPLITQPPHLPPFKQNGPKGAIVANLPPGSLVGNQYIVGQSNVPYFPHHPIYYYEEVPPVMNNQQRLAHHMSTGYDVSYQSTSPATRDGVHYNV
uniref:Ubiquitin-associated protein 2 n=1 Tax=Lygus hesperus TaxID=30085 RepID=A0A0A9ZHH9_LYGHE